MATNKVIPGAYAMTKLKVGSEDVYGLMLEMNVYEDLASNIVTADVTLSEAYNLLSNKDFKEGDIVEMEATNLKDDTSNPEAGKLKYKFEIVKIINRKTLKQDLQIYTLVLASGGWSSNVKTRISKSFKQKKYSEMVQTIFDEELKVKEGMGGSLKGKSLEKEDTDGMFNVIIPNWKPLTAINWLAARAIKEKACNFLFWEDHEKFHFKPIDKLMKEGPVAKYYHQTQNVSENSGSTTTSYYNAEEVNFKDTADVLFYGMAGMLGNRMMEIDFTKKLVTHFSDEAKTGGHIEQDKAFDYDKSFGSVKHADQKGKPFVDFASDFKEGSRFTMLPKHTYAHEDMEHFEQEKWFRERISQHASLDYFHLHIWVTGSFKRKVGEKIEFMYHSPEKQQGEPKKDKKVSGNYLIKSIRRKFDQTQYVMAMDIIKDNKLS